MKIKACVVLPFFSALLAILVVGPGRAGADDIAWTNKSGGDWSVANNWSPNKIPGPGDTALITSDGTYTVTVNANTAVTSMVLGGPLGKQSLVIKSQPLTVTGPMTVGANGTLQIEGNVFAPTKTLVCAGVLRIISGTLAGAGLITINGELEWIAGNISGASEMTISSSASCKIALTGAANLTDRTVKNSGRIIWSSGTFQTRGNCGIEILEGGTMEITDGAEIRPALGSFGLRNKGMILKSGTAKTLVGGMENDGFVEIQSGTLRVGTTDTSGSNSGRYQLGTGATLEIQGSPVFEKESAISGAGSSRVNAADMTISGTFDIGGTVQVESGKLTFKPGSKPVSLGNSLQVNGATLTLNSGQEVKLKSLIVSGDISGSDIVTVNGPIVWNSGGFAGNGNINALGGVTIQGAAQKNLAGPTLRNASQTTWTGGQISQSNGGLIENLAGGTFDLGFDAQLNIALGGSGFINHGLLRKTGGTATARVGPITNDGTIEVLSGVLNSPNAFTQLPSGELAIRIGGTAATTGSSRFEVTGTIQDDKVVADGSLRLILAAGFIPKLGDSFQIISLPKRNGRFICYNGLNQPSAGVQLAVQYSGDQINALVKSTSPATGPSLFSSESGENFVICWGSEFTGYRAQTKTDLKLPWEDLKDAPPSATKVTIPITPDRPLRFFRLTK
ncbi:MAG: hypothetical protein EXS31_04145 [Pedosphaera sp.]|nr:hypothetical protein [Pedosphaera sp.]